VKKRVLSVTARALGSDALSLRVSNMLKAMQKLGYEVELVQYVKKGPNPSTSFQTAEIDGYSKFLIKSPRCLTFFRHFKRVAKGKYDVVIGNTTNAALFSILGKLTTPLLFDIHGIDAEEYMLEQSFQSGLEKLHSLLYALIFKSANRLTCNLSTKISCVSHKMIDYLSARGIPSNKLVYIPNCVRLESFVPLAPSDPKLISLKQDLRICNGKVVFGYIGGFQKWQGVENFVAAAREIRDKRIAFLIVGGKQAQQEGQILFVPIVKHEMIAAYYSICDVLALPRPSHPATDVAAPTKFAEYAAMGKAILATNVGDAADLIRKYDCGVIAKNNSTKELKKAITYLSECGTENLKKMGRAAILLAQEEFSFDVMVRNFGACLEEITKS